MDIGNLTEVKSALDLYLSQYNATDKLWAYFSSVTLAVVGFSVASDKVSKSFFEASIVVIGYLLFCFGNFKALSLSQEQLVQFADLARAISEKNKVSMSALVPFPSDVAANFYWFVAIAVAASILLITWRRRSAPSAAATAAK